MLNKSLKLASENELILHTNKLILKEIKRINNKLNILQNDGIIDESDNDENDEINNENNNNKKEKTNLNLFHILLGSALGFIVGEMLSLNLSK